MKLDLTNFPYELSNGIYKDCSLGDALVREFAIQCISELNDIRETERQTQRQKDINDFVNSRNITNINLIIDNIK